AGLPQYGRSTPGTADGHRRRAGRRGRPRFERGGGVAHGPSHRVGWEGPPRSLAGRNASAGHGQAGGHRGRLGGGRRVVLTVVGGGHTARGVAELRSEEHTSE